MKVSPKCWYHITEIAIMVVLIAKCIIDKLLLVNEMMNPSPKNAESITETCHSFSVALRMQNKT